MIKKYFAMTIIAASVSLAACSSDDDDDDVTVPVVPDGPVVPAATLGTGGTAFDTIVNSDAHQKLEDAIIAAGLADTLDNGEFTIFAPTDAAFDALTETPDAATLARILTYHVLAGTVDSTAVSTLITDNGGDPVAADTILVDGEGAAAETQTVELATSLTASTGVSVNTNDITAVDVTILGDDEAADTAPVGLVHVIDAILIPPEAPVVVVPPVEGEGGSALIGSDTDYSEAGAAFIANFGADLDNSDGNTQTFMFFVPSNAALTAASLTGADLTSAVVAQHIQTTVSVLAEGGTITTVPPEGEPAPTYAVAADTEVEGGFTVGGFPVILLGETPAGGEIYGIEGVLL